MGAAVRVGVVLVRSGLHHIAGHEGFARSGSELQLTGAADQRQNAFVVRLVALLGGDFHADSAGAQFLHGGFCVTAVGQTQLKHVNGPGQGRAEVAFKIVRSGYFVFHIHTALQVQAQAQGFRPVIGIGRRQPGQQFMQPSGREFQSREPEHSEQNREREHHTQRNDSTFFAVHALFTGFHVDRILLRNADASIIVIRLLFVKLLHETKP